MPLEMVMEIFHHYLTVASGPERRHFSNTSPLFRKEAGHTTLMITPSDDYPDDRTEADFVVPFSRLSEFSESVSSMGEFSTDFGTRFGNIGRVIIFAIQPQFHTETIAEVLSMFDVEHLDIYAESTPSAFLVPFLATVAPSVPTLTSLTLNFHDFERDLETVYRVHATVKSAIFKIPEDEIDVDGDLKWLAEYPEEAPECDTPYFNYKHPWSNVLALQKVLKEFSIIQNLKIYVSKKYFDDNLVLSKVDRLADAHRNFPSGRLRSYVYECLERQKDGIAGDKCLIRLTDRWAWGKKWQVQSSIVVEGDSDDEGNMECSVAGRAWDRMWKLYHSEAIVQEQLQDALTLFADQSQLHTELELGTDPCHQLYYPMESALLEDCLFVKMVFGPFKRLRALSDKSTIATTVGCPRTLVANDPHFAIGKNAHKGVVKELHKAQKASIEAIANFKDINGWFDGFNPSAPITESFIVASNRLQRAKLSWENSVATLYGFIRELNTSLGGGNMTELIEALNLWCPCCSPSSPVYSHIRHQFYQSQIEVLFQPETS
ncbi:hypothetical protein NMY22_g11791 [Coprinellus aureogranulatus]|nr:hypothetical protein NMY22_g11791 [Coprinellus aureogranulatus]